MTRQEREIQREVAPKRDKLMLWRVPPFQALSTIAAIAGNPGLSPEEKADQLDKVGVFVRPELVVNGIGITTLIRETNPKFSIIVPDGNHSPYTPVNDVSAIFTFNDRRLNLTERYYLAGDDNAGPTIYYEMKFPEFTDLVKLNETGEKAALLRVISTFAPLNHHSRAFFSRNDRWFFSTGLFSEGMSFKALAHSEYMAYLFENEEIGSEITSTIKNHLGFRRYNYQQSVHQWFNYALNSFSNLEHIAKIINLNFLDFLIYPYNISDETREYIIQDYLNNSINFRQIYGALLISSEINELFNDDYRFFQVITDILAHPVMKNGYEEFRDYYQYLFKNPKKENLIAINEIFKLGGLRTLRSLKDTALIERYLELWKEGNMDQLEAEIVVEALGS